MQAISVGQMVQALHKEPQGLCSWEQDAVRCCFSASHNGYKPHLLSLKQVELMSTIFRRLYHA